MKRLALLTVFGLAACGGGGGGGNSGSTPPQPITRIANTSLPYYLPMSAGNSWTFATGGKMVDIGSITLQCSCPENGAAIERIGLYPPNSTAPSGSFFFVKNTPNGGTQLTNLIGVENDAGTSNITLASSTQFPYGVPIMDDSPHQNESWNDGAGDLSTITSIGGTMMLANGSEVINVATDQITGSFSPITWSFAKGVGFTQIAVGTQSTSMTSFSVNTATSNSAARNAQSLTAAQGHSGLIDLGLLEQLFP